MSPRIRHFGLGTGAVVIALIAAVLVGFSFGNGTDRSAKVSPGERLPADLAPGVSVIGDSPFGVPATGAQVYTGKELLAFGSSPTASATVGYVPETGEWREYPTAPFDGFVSGAIAVWADGHFVVVGLDCSDFVVDDDEGLKCLPGGLKAASLDPSNNVWTELPQPPAPDFKGSSVFGESIGDFDGQAVFRVAVDTFLALDVEKSTWRVLRAPPVEPTIVCLTDGGELVSATIPEENPVLAAGPVEQSVKTFVLDPGAESWQPGKELRAQITAPFLYYLACGGDNLLAYTADFGSVWMFDATASAWLQQVSPPTGLARRPPPPGTDASKLEILPPINLPYRAWTGREFVFWDPTLTSSAKPGQEPGSAGTAWNGVAVAFDPSAGSWRSAAPGAGGEAPGQWTNGIAIFLAGPKLVVYNPG